MVVSVIVPTYNGAYKVLNLLRSLEQQTYPIDEVVVVVDGSTDKTLDLISNNEFNLKNLKIVSQENQGRASTRNRGVTESTGELLIFLDDDMRPLSHCIESHIKHFIARPSSIGVGVQIEDFNKTNTDFLRFKAEMSRGWMDKYSNSNGYFLLDENKPFITAANFSISKDTFQLLGGFEPGLKDAEDFDLAMRASEAGVPIYFINNAEAWHDDLITCEKYILRLREYETAQKTLSELRPNLYYKYGYFAPTKQSFLKMLIFSLFGQWSLVRAIDNEIFIKVLPKALRFKLYSIVITALGVYYVKR
ncbi:glycosyltransferase family 2 protein [Hymenobacter tenuis]